MVKSLPAIAQRELSAFEQGLTVEIGNVETALNAATDKDRKRLEDLLGQQPTAADPERMDPFQPVVAETPAAGKAAPKTPATPPAADPMGGTDQRKVTICSGAELWRQLHQSVAGKKGPLVDEAKKHNLEQDEANAKLKQIAENTLKLAKVSAIGV
jgi:hypothetical protein